MGSLDARGARSLAKSSRHSAVRAFDFPANDVVLNFATPPGLADSAALFESVGRIDPELFETGTSGYTQFGRAYLSLQSAVPDAQFIAGYARAADQSRLEYTPIVNGAPSLFQGGAAFPGNDWTVNTRGEEYLSRIPAGVHRALARIRAFHLRATREVLRSPPATTGSPRRRCRSTASSRAHPASADAMSIPSINRLCRKSSRASHAFAGRRHVGAHAADSRETAGRARAKAEAATPTREPWPWRRSGERWDCLEGATGAHPGRFALRRRRPSGYHAWSCRRGSRLC